MIASTKQQINVNGDENEIHGIETICPEIEPDQLNLFNVDNLINALKDMVTISWIPGHYILRHILHRTQSLSY